MDQTQTTKCFTTIKGKAITQELEEFYTLYEGQSWKNVISIGDSDFERLGTQEATRRYIIERGGDSSATAARRQEVDGHVYQVRTKTFKMLEAPSIDELILQLKMLQRWLPDLVV